MKEFYLGFSSGGRKSFRDVKSYRAQKALALKKPKVEHYDALETRAPKAREAALMLALPKLIAHAKKRAPGSREFFFKVNPVKDKALSARRLASVPVTRKSDLTCSAERPAAARRR